MAQPEQSETAFEPPKRQHGTGLDRIRQIVAHSDALIEELRNLAFDPNTSKQLRERYTITQVAEMIGRSANGIRKAEASGALPPPQTNDRGRRTGYSLQDVNRIRGHFNIQTGRAASDWRFKTSRAVSARAPCARTSASIWRSAACACW